MPPPSAHHNGIIQYYVLNVTEMDTAVQIQIESLTTEETISALHPFYTYEVTLSAVTVSSGPFSSPVVFQLPEDGMFLYNYRYLFTYIFVTEPSGPPTNFTVKVLSSDSLLVSWNPPLLQDQNGIITHYTVTITNLNSGNTLEHTVFNNSLEVYSLDPHTEYEVYVLAATTAGSGPPTVPLSVHTQEDGNYLCIKELHMSLYYVLFCSTNPWTCKFDSS